MGELFGEALLIDQEFVLRAVGEPEPDAAPFPVPLGALVVHAADRRRVGDQDLVGETADLREVVAERMDERHLQLFARRGRRLAELAHHLLEMVLMVGDQARDRDAQDHRTETSPGALRAVLRQVAAQKGRDRPRLADRAEAGQGGDPATARPSGPPRPAADRAAASCSCASSRGNVLPSTGARQGPKRARVGGSLGAGFDFA